MRGFKLRSIIALFFLVLMGASVLMAHVWKQNAYVRLSKEAVRLAREGKALRDTLALLELEAGELRNMARIEALARARFGLEYGAIPVLIYPEAGDAEREDLTREADEVRASLPTAAAAAASILLPRPVRAEDAKPKGRGG